MSQSSYTSGTAMEPQLESWVNQSLRLQYAVDQAFHDYVQPIYRRAFISTAMLEAANALIASDIHPAYGDMWAMDNAKSRARSWAEHGDKARCLAAVQSYMDAILAVIDRTPEGIAA